MSKPIRRTFTVVEVINGSPALTNYALKKDADEAFEKIVRENMVGCELGQDYIEKKIAEAITTSIYDIWDGYYVELMETDLVG